MDDPAIFAVMSHELALSPGGHLFVEPNELAVPKLAVNSVARLSEAFSRSGARGLELLVSEFFQQELPPTFFFWRNLARKYFTLLCHCPSSNDRNFSIVKPSGQEWDDFVMMAPPMKGLDYLNKEVVGRLWDELDAHVHVCVSEISGGLPAYLTKCNPLWNAVGRVTFHLAENKRNPAQPFAFLATYSNRVSEQGRVQHLPLGRALEEYAGAKNRSVLETLLSPVQRAAQNSNVVRQMLDSRAIFHPQVWRPDQAFSFLKEIPLFEQSGLVVRIPDWWKGGRPPRPQVNVRLGEASGKSLGKDSLLDFKVEVVLEGETLSPSELEAILRSSSGLTLLKGKWVEVDREKLRQVLNHWKSVQSTAAPDGIPFWEGMRLLSGFRPGQDASPEMEAARADWSSVVAGRQLQEVLNGILQPEVSTESDPGPDLKAQLRPYQRQGAHWLWFMNKLGLGACLADDMGLGKTIQVISLLLTIRRSRLASKSTSSNQRGLLIVPASLIANWKAEIMKFAPSLVVFFAHPSENPNACPSTDAKKPHPDLSGHDLVITSYSMAGRLAWLKEMCWDVIILDEAQAIKNAGARQTRAVKELRCRHRIALSGTPIENRLSDLWSLFDFLCPGLLGGAKEFAGFLKINTQKDQNHFASLRRLVRPYILRRIKTDKRIISDLPDKVEMDAFCPLVRRQAALYEQSVRELAERLDASHTVDIQRRGIILAFLTRFKQICNHPSQWLGDGAYDSADSGKFHRLAELCEGIAAKQEKVLVFTQYREITDPLSRHLEAVFGQPGLVLHGGTPVGKRKQLVDAFQREGGPPFFVLSLKAGGTGLNLTAASHVVHFDRWWNPAVENQATDRAFRIGQKQNVMVHKFICRGTLEERINEVIAAKRALAGDILGEGAEKLMTEMSNSELLRFVALDINAVSSD